MARLLVVLSVLSLLCVGGIFGFFYAWVCSTMWGLDAGDPGVAIAAMQSMNASVRNPVFFPIFFGTPVVLAITARVALLDIRKVSALLLALATVTYVLGAFLPTALINVPMNEALALVEIPLDQDAAQRIWQDYSGRWQMWNMIRTCFSGLALMLTGVALINLNSMRA
ncbi:DUF1772 domain-containing protein [Shimia aestuarii]|uniref:Uncharacterized membrane protein n=1 Tax=Shimia aestuarii TaxID=254406 RepID=A0A1I4JVP1_9RHOB|nr:anthrone oxygenase family protein [Shimia aestuarii]SFL70293.1 Uncharacterized membrane protein [Shimia aestuarii]